MSRAILLVPSLLVPAITTRAADWGMAQANAGLPHPSMLRPVSTPAEEISTLAVFASTACVNCHVVRGVGANGRFGPDLTHLMSRETLAAGAALNTTANSKAWI